MNCERCDPEKEKFGGWAERTILVGGFIAYLCTTCANEWHEHMETRKDFDVCSEIHSDLRQIRYSGTPESRKADKLLVDELRSRLKEAEWELYSFARKFVANAKSKAA